jgi:hypothetical protein
MSNWTNATCCDGVEEPFQQHEVDVALTVLSVMIVGICSLLCIFGLFRKMASIEAVLEDVEPPQESEENRRRERKEYISNRLIVKEWIVLDDPQVELVVGDQDTPPSGEKAVEAPQPLAPRLINSSPASCAVGSEDCDSLVVAGKEEMAGCAICLSHFEPLQLVCESNNSSCQHVFHEDCLVDWLMKYHENCPMCREVYLLETV